MAKIKIGDRDYVIPPLNFIALERAWPYIEKATVTIHPIDGPSAIIRVIAAGLMEDNNFDPKLFGWTPPETPKDADALEVLATQLPPSDEEIFDAVTIFLKKNLKSSQLPELTATLDEITVEAGLVAPEGEAPAPVEMEIASPETAANTSQN